MATENAATFQSFKRNQGWLEGHVPQAAEQELRFLKMFDFYDGPLMGWVEWKEKKYWYEVVSDFENERKRYFALLELSDEEYQKQLHWHLRLKEHIKQEQRANQSAWDQDFNDYKKQCENLYRNRQVAAWFCMN